MKIIDLDNFKYKNRVERFRIAKNPMFTITSKIDITNLVKRKKKHKLNCMICYCIQNASQLIDNFHYDFNNDNSIKYFENVYVNWIIENKIGLHSYIGIPYQKTFSDFEKLYNFYNNVCYENCEHIFLDNQALVSTSSVVNREFESVSCGYTEDFLRPFMIWGKMHKNLFRYKLNISFRFHHSFFDGKEVGQFFNLLQKTINNFKE